jgi:2,4-diketo-3-deoxy-L-fuconate hydrolase
MAIPFALGSFSVAGCPPFAGVVIDDHVTAVTALQLLCEDLGVPLSTPETVFGLLQAWDRNSQPSRPASTS